MREDEDLQRIAELARAGGVGLRHVRGAQFLSRLTMGANPSVDYDQTVRATFGAVGKMPPDVDVWVDDLALY